jgi:hypothetical protein
MQQVGLPVVDGDRIATAPPRELLMILSLVRRDCAEARSRCLNATT